MSEWFAIQMGPCQGCEMSPCWFDIFMDGVVREVNARMLGRGLSVVMLKVESGN